MTEIRVQFSAMTISCHPLSVRIGITGQCHAHQESEHQLEIAPRGCWASLRVDQSADCCYLLLTPWAAPRALPTLSLQLVIASHIICVQCGLQEGVKVHTQS